MSPPTGLRKSLGLRALAAAFLLAAAQPIYSQTLALGTGSSEVIWTQTTAPITWEELYTQDKTIIDDDGRVHFLTSFNVNAADTTNADQLRAGEALGLNLTGAGRTVGLWDEGLVRNSHEAFINGGPSRVTVHEPGTTSSHSTHVAGTIGGDNTISNSAARGMASSVLIRSRTFNGDVGELTSDAALIQFSNHSYGLNRGWSSQAVSTSVGSRQIWYGDRSVSATEDNKFGQYGSEARSFDTVLANNPHLLSVWSVGNDRGNTFTGIGSPTEYVAFFSTPPAPGTFISNEGGGNYVVSTSQYSAPGGDGNGGTGYDSIGNYGQLAKNVLLVGAVNAYTDDPHVGSAITVASFSSYGPTDDGRLAPHVMADGVAVLSANSTADNAYNTRTGTSMSAPNVTGTAALLHEHFDNQPGKSGPLAATQKAYLVHTATDITTPGSGTVGPDYSSGYGLVNGAAAAQLITEAFTTPLATRSQHIFETTHVNNAEQLLNYVTLGGSVKATIAWTDPAGDAMSGLDNPASVLINDLDLWITQGATTYYPWNLDPANPADAAFRTSLNHRDNLEQVFIDNLIAGLPITIHIGQTGSLFNSLNQNFSLVLSGVLVPEPTGILLATLGLIGLVAKSRSRRRFAR
jgi:subtilisin family serine protease